MGGYRPVGLVGGMCIGGMVGTVNEPKITNSHISRVNLFLLSIKVILGIEL